MARLRTLHIGTKTVGDVTEEQHILILDGLNADQLQNDFEAFEAFEGAPPILAFGFDIDIPGVDAARWVMPDPKGTQDAINQMQEDVEAARWPRITFDVTGTDAELIRTIRKATGG